MTRFLSFGTHSKIALLLFVIFYIGFGIAVTVFQEKLIYLRFSQDFDTCAAFKSAEKIELGGTRAYFKNVGDQLAVLYHGNAGSACDRGYWAEIFENNGYSYLIVEYEGYSNDGSQPSHEGVKRNVDDVVSFITSGNFRNIAVVGESIGSGAASYHASLSAPQKILLIAPFSSLADLAKSVYWFYPTFLMVDNAFDNTIYLKDYSGSALVIHGEADNGIPQKFGRKLFDTIGSTNKRFVSIPQAGHNDILGFDDFIKEVNNFLKSP